MPGLTFSTQNAPHYSPEASLPPSHHALGPPQPAPTQRFKLPAPLGPTPAPPFSITMMPRDSTSQPPAHHPPLAPRRSATCARRFFWGPRSRCAQAPEVNGAQRAAPRKRLLKTRMVTLRSRRQPTGKNLNLPEKSPRLFVPLRLMHPVCRGPWHLPMERQQGPGQVGPSPDPRPQHIKCSPGPASARPCPTRAHGSPVSGPSEKRLQEPTLPQPPSRREAPQSTQPPNRREAWSPGVSVPA